MIAGRLSLTEMKLVLGLFLFSKVIATYNQFTDGPDQVLIILIFLIVNAKKFLINNSKVPTEQYQSYNNRRLAPTSYIGTCY